MGLGFVGIWNGANQFLRSRGVQLSFSRLTRFNLPSRRAHTAAWGAAGGAHVCSADVGGWNSWLLLLSPYLHLSLGEHDRARLKLTPNVQRSEAEAQAFGRLARRARRMSLKLQLDRNQVHERLTNSF